MAPCRKGSTIFRPVKIDDQQLLVSGGYNRRSEPVPFRTKTVDNEKLVFLRMEAREPWLIKACTGSTRILPGLSGRTTLISELRDKLQRACDGEPTAGHDIRCHVEASTASAGADDPMAEVAEDEVVRTQRAVGNARGIHQRNRYYLSNCKDKVLVVSMPERARVTGIDGGERLVRLYCESRQNIWLCSMDANWALQYLKDELERKGVTHVAPDDRGPGPMPEAPVSATPPVVAGPLHLEDVQHEPEVAMQVD